MMQSGWPLLGPLDWLHYVNKKVKVKAREEQLHRGWLLTVDPVSASVVLVSFGEAGGASVRVVMGHAVQEVEVLQEADRQTAERLRGVLLPRRAARLDPEEARRRRESVRRWLERNRVPVEQEGEALRVAGALTVQPPYGAEDCRSSNEIILARIQKLLEENPEGDGPGDA
ncbi:gem-associated protein 6 [Centroberyx gerrardi]|uniref:gem-associated protein 6 n=1 Tax=Centroberyx gerrardi TaxID=166262 RepID=UPI003AB032DC